MAALHGLEEENVWLDRQAYEDAEHDYHHTLASQKNGCLTNSQSSSSDGALVSRLTAVELENKQLKKITSSLEDLVKRLEGRISALELGKPGSVPTTSAAPSVKPAAKEVNGDASEEEDDFELFGDEEDDEAAEKLKQERVKAYMEKKSTKPVLIAKSNIILDIKPWDDETDMAELERSVRTIEMEGLLWGSSKLVPLAYTIKKLQISCVVEDDKVSTEDLEDKIMAFEELVQSVDIAAFNKI